jgi:hypothetical protein
MVPLPALSQMRAMAVLRGVRVVRRGVELELGDHLAAEHALGQHSLHGLLDRKRGIALEHVAVGLGLEAAGDAGVVVVELLVELVAREEHLVGVHDDDEVTRVLVRGVLGLVLAAQHVGDLAGEASEGLTGGIDHPPSARALGLRLGHHEGSVGHDFCCPSLPFSGEGARETTRRGGPCQGDKGEDPATGQLREQFHAVRESPGGRATDVRGMSCNEAPPRGVVPGVPCFMRIQEN